jgi:hypothetical protein
VAVSIRAFLPSDLAAPAPIEDLNLTLDIDNSPYSP